MSFIQQGAILGAVLGLAGGLARGSVRSGGVRPWSAGGSGRPWRPRPHTACCRSISGTSTRVPNALNIPLLTHGGSGRPSGLRPGWRSGLGSAAGAGGRACALGGLLGGVAATMVYEVVGALAFPLDKTSQPGLRDRRHAALRPARGGSVRRGRRGSGRGDDATGVETSARPAPRSETCAHSRRTTGLDWACGPPVSPPGASGASTGGRLETPRGSLLGLRRCRPR